MKMQSLWKKTGDYRNCSLGVSRKSAEESYYLRPTDADLVRRARQGDELACHEIVDLYSNYLYRLAYSLVGNAADAADVLQETFSGAFRHLPSFKGRASIRTWLSRILLRQAARHHRSRRRHEMASLDAVAQVSQTPLGRGDSAPAARACDARMDVMAALQTLSPAYREIVVLRELRGMSYSEIADVLGVPPGTVESRLFRARRHLREQLKDYLV